MLGVSDLTLTTLLLAGIVALLFPAGMILWAGIAGHGNRGTQPPVHTLTAMTVGVLGFFATGFALQYGGAAGLYPALGELAGLRQEWAPLTDALGRGWGLLGTDGFFVVAGGSPAVYSLFLFQAVVLASALAISATTLAGQVRPWLFAIYAVFFSMFLYPVLGNWAWGGGWLSQLGRGLDLGHGFVDLAGAGVVQMAGGCAALAGALALRRRPSPGAGADEPASDDVGCSADSAASSVAVAGLLLSAVGWLAVLAGNAVLWDVSLPVVLVNGLVAMACAACVALGYMAFATGQADAGMTARGVLAGLAAISAAAPFVSPPAAALIGAVAGLLACFGTHLVGRVLRLHDPLGAISTHGLGGLWGLVALGLFAEGRIGTGWNGIGLREYLGVVSQGVTGLWPAAGFQPDSQQIAAQLQGAAAVAAWVRAPSVALFRIARMVQERRERPRRSPLPASSRPVDEPAVAVDSDDGHRQGTPLGEEGEGEAR